MPVKLAYCSPKMNDLEMIIHYSFALINSTAKSNIEKILQKSNNISYITSRYPDG
jgi:hypothetical protein